MKERKKSTVRRTQKSQHTQGLGVVQAVLGLLALDALDESMHRGFRLSFSPSRIWEAQRTM